MPPPPPPPFLPFPLPPSVRYTHHPFPLILLPPIFSLVYHKFLNFPHNFLQLAGLSDAEIAEMEGAERRAVEARVQALRNISVLLDAALLQFQQYLAIVGGGPAVPISTAQNPQNLQNNAPSTSSSSSTGGGTAETAERDNQRSEQQPQQRDGMTT